MRIKKIIKNQFQHYSTLGSLPDALILSLLLICGLASWQPAVAQQEGEFAGERIVHVLDEPRHRTVLQEGQLYMIDMQLRPGDESLLHQHNQAILINYISRPEGPQFGQLNVVTEYATEEFIHKIVNPGPYLFRVIALIHDGNGEPINTNDAPQGMELAPEIENNWFRAYSIKLAPGEATLTQQHTNPTVIIQGTGGLTHVTREDGITRELTRSGEWAYRNAGASYQISNVGDSPVVITVNEFRLQHSK